MATTAQGKAVLDLYYNSQKVAGLLNNAGIPSKIVPWVVGQVFFETGNLTNGGARFDNNYSGIKFTNRPGITRGRPATDGGYFAHFPSLQAWANDMYRVLSIKGKNGAPIDATTLHDYVTRLAANNYFGRANPATYEAGIMTWLAKIYAAMKTAYQYAPAPARDPAVTNQVPPPPDARRAVLPSDPGTGQKSWLDWFKEGGTDWGTGNKWNWLRIGVAVIGGVVVVKILTR